MRTAVLALSVGLLAAVAPASRAPGLPAASGAAVEVGKPVPDFRVGTTGGKTVEGSELRGKRVLVFFWASW